MLIVSLKKHFPARWPEWFMSAMLFAWGLNVAIHPELFTQDATRVILSELDAMAGGFPPAAIWGLSAIAMGIFRATALFINGACTRTPLVRLIMSFGSAFIWTQVAIGLMKTGVANTGFTLYAGLVVMDIVSAYRAASDMVYAETARHNQKQERRRDERRSIA